MLFGSPLRAEISRSGSASPEVRNADSSCEEWTTDLTRYGSRAAVFLVLIGPQSIPWIPRLAWLATAPCPPATAHCGVRNRLGNCETPGNARNGSKTASFQLCRCGMTFVGV